MSFFGIPKGFLGWVSRGSIIPPPPYIIASKSLITGLDYNAGSGPSTGSASFNVSALGLTPAAGNITMTPPTNFEISDDNGGTWQDTPFLIPYTSGTITTAAVYKVRLKAGLSGNNYSENIVLSGADAPNFNIACYGEVVVVSEFIITVKTDNAGSSASNQFTLPLNPSYSYNCLINWGDGNSTTQTTTVSPTHTYASPGTYQISITGTFESILFDNSGDKLKLLQINNWGVIVWKTMFQAFFGCSNMQGTYADVPDLSVVTNMSGMFLNCSSFNYSVAGWNTTAITNMQSTFQGCTIFNQDMSTWNVGNVTNMIVMFYQAAAFNGNMSTWDVTSLLNAGAMFQAATAFNSDISSWVTSSLTNMNDMFRSTSFNQNIGGWDVSNVISMQTTFFDTPFNQDISSWDVSSVTSMLNMFALATAFNQPLNAWDVSSVVNMANMFSGASSFNQALSSWALKVASVINMSAMFQSSAFNQNISTWVTTNVTNMSSIFATSPFNQPINSWNVSNVTDFSAMFFNNTAFNQALNSWNMDSATNISFMFQNATAFNQDIGSWNVHNVVNANGFMQGKAAANYLAANLDSIYNGWSLLTLQPNVIISFGSIKYTAAGIVSKAILISAPNNWTITDGGI